MFYVQHAYATQKEVFPKEQVLHEISVNETFKFVQL